MEKPFKMAVWKIAGAISNISLPLWVWIAGCFPFLKRPFKKAFYDMVARAVPSETAPFRLMNYGYASTTSPDYFPIVLDSTDQEEFLYSWRLVYETVKSGRLENKYVLVVGCGRGGDAYFVKRYMNAGSVTAIDFSERVIDICKRNYRLDGLTFEAGDAEHLIFADRSFDVVVNIESSHCYPNLRKFYGEVYRVLKPEGIFLYADFFRDKRHKNYLEETGFKILEEKDITQNVVLAAEEGYERRKELIQKAVPKCFFNEALEWSGTKGTGMYRLFKKRLLPYKRFTLVRHEKCKKERS